MKAIRYTLAAQCGATLYALIVAMTLLAKIILGGLKISSAYIYDQSIANTINSIMKVS